ncbi:MAG: PD40 domain-containing protein [Lentisphaeria bacterium]|nr:PD40 domain-containing protein [Lentisphaeria bacterium]
MKKNLLFAMFFSISVFVSAQVEVSISGKKGDDSLVFQNFNGSAEMRSQVERDLRNCGWFEIQQRGVANFIVSGSSSGNQVTLVLSDGAGAEITRVTARGATPAEASHRAVDALLKFIYKVDGICSSKIVFTAEISPGQKEVYICDYDGRNFKRITRNRGLSLDPVWSPDGRSIVYSYIGKAYTVLMQHDIRSGKARQLAKFKGLNAGGAISPDGAYVALVLSKDNQVDLYVRPLNGGTLRRLTRDKAVEASPCWSPDGRSICYVSDAGTGRPRLYIISVSGGRPRRLSGSFASESVSPSWGKDGKITYSGKAGNFSVFVADPNGVAARTPRQQLGQITRTGGDWESPSWAPDNRHLVCSHNGGLFIVDTWTGKSRQIVGGKSKCTLPDWSPLQ